MLHPRAFKVTVVWTLALLFLGSIVHATESSLACPDWPTCFGSMVPEMTGGVFWEHLHRLVAGGLVLMFALATWLAHRETGDRPWVLRACLAGLGLLVVQSIFGGLTDARLHLPHARDRPRGGGTRCRIHRGRRPAWLGRTARDRVRSRHRSPTS
jgi:heme A synthase